MKTILYIHGMGGGSDSRIPSILNEWFEAHRPDIRVIVRTYDFNPDRAAEQIDGWYEALQPDLVIGESLGGVHALALLARRSSGADGATTVRGCRDFDPSGGMHPQTAAPPPASNALPAFPLLLVSPALNAPAWFRALRFLTLIPGVRPLLNRIYKPREGDRQTIDFSYANMRAWPPYRATARAATSLAQVRKEADSAECGEGDTPVWGRCDFRADTFPSETATQTPVGHNQWGRSSTKKHTFPKTTSTDTLPTNANVHAFFGRKDHYRRSGVVSIRQWRRLAGPDSYTLYDGSHYMEEEHLKALLIPAILERLR